LWLLSLGGCAATKVATLRQATKPTAMPINTNANPVHGSPSACTNTPTVQRQALVKSTPEYCGLENTAATKTRKYCHLVRGVASRFPRRRGSPMVWENTLQASSPRDNHHCTPSHGRYMIQRFSHLASTACSGNQAHELARFCARFTAQRHMGQVCEVRNHIPRHRPWKTCSCEQSSCLTFLSQP